MPEIEKKLFISVARGKTKREKLGSKTLFKIKRREYKKNQHFASSKKGV